MTNRYSVRPLDGKWAVYDGDKILDPIAFNSIGHSNSTAWRLADHMNMEAKSRNEDVAEWAAKKDANR